MLTWFVRKILIVSSRYMLSYVAMIGLTKNRSAQIHSQFHISASTLFIALHFLPDSSISSCVYNGILMPTSTGQTLAMKFKVKMLCFCCVVKSR